MTLQYLRKVGLIVSKDSNSLDLSNMRIQFRTFAADVDAPPTAYIRVWNLKRETATKIQKEYDKVSLQAGYESSDTGIIFSGTIVQVKKGAQDAIDSFVDIMASDLDLMYNFSVVSKTLAAGASKKDQVDTIIKSAADQGASAGNIPNSLGTGGTLPRGKVLFGMARDKLTDVANSSQMYWSIENGKINFLPLTGYASGDIVVLNSETGMLGVPEATNAGIEVRCLLNPRLKAGGRVQIDNQDITTTTVRQQGQFPTFGALNFPANLSDNGVYKILVVENAGDTRGNQYESQLTCLAVDSSSPKDSSVAVAG